MRVAVSAVCFLAVMCGGLAFADPPAVRPVAGAVIVTRTSPTEASLLWDATLYVTQLVNEKTTDDRGMHAIEATALRALAEKGKTLKARTLTLKVTYAKTGAVSPVYGSATFAGFEPVLTLSARRAEAVQHADAWSAELAKGTVPKGVTVDVTGKLPPSQ
jgi:hypothetical protein